MVKYKVVWGGEAKLDLFEIYTNFIDQFGSTTYCKNLNLKFNRAIKLLVKNPLIGTETSIPYVRLMIADDYQIIYEILDDTILIAMICECRKIDMSKNYSLKAKSKNVSKIIFD